MRKIIQNQDEELIKVPVNAGSVVFIKYPKQHKPLIKIFTDVIPC